MNLAYSCYLKHVVIIDVLIIALGFLLRALAGVVASGVTVTSWFLLCIFLLALFLALGKRYGELKELGSGNTSRRVLKQYSLELLKILSAMVCTMLITSYALFAQGTEPGVPLPCMMLTLPIVIYGVFRYWYLLLVRGEGERPEELLLHDKGIAVCVTIYVLTIILLRDV